MRITLDAKKAAHDKYREVLVDLRIAEGAGGFKSASQHRRALEAALEAAAPHLASDAFEEGYGVGYSDAIWSQGHNPRERNPHRSQL